MSAPASAPRILLVEDTPSLQMLYRTVLTKAGYPPTCASTAADALEKFAVIRPAIVLLDLMLPDRDGFSVLTEMLERAPETRVIMITANGSVDKAIEATRKGAHDFLVKPLGDIRLVGAVANAISDYRAAMQEPQAGRAGGLDLDEFVAKSAPMQKVVGLMHALAKSMAPVIIIGASGTGKTTCARMIHSLSPRARKPFVALDLAGLDKDSMEAALFGTGPSSHSSAAIRAQGAIRKALGGTLLLRSVPRLSLEHQARLVSILNSGVMPGTSAEAALVDVRFICAMDHDPLEDLRAGRLRNDLYYRLCVLPLMLPPLRARVEDIPDLAQRFLADLAAEENKPVRGIDAAALRLLQDHVWGGNLHELRNVLHQAVVLHDAPTLSRDMLPEALGARAPAASDASTAGPTDLEKALTGMTLAEIEAYAIQAAVARHDGSVPRASQELDIAPSTIYRKRDAWRGKPH